MTRRLRRCVVVACALARCRPADPNASPRAPGPRMETVARAIVPASDADSRWRVRAAEAQAHGLAPVGFSLESAPQWAIPARFPAAGTLAIFSGPPGAPLGAQVDTDGLSAGDATALRDALRASTSLRIGTPRAVGEPARVRVGGVERAGVALVAGVGAARAHHCVVLVPSPDGVSRGLLLWLYTGATAGATPDCAAVLAQPELAAIAEGFRAEAL